MTASAALTVAAAALVALALMGAVVLGAAFVAYRMARKWWRRWSAGAAYRGALAAAAGMSAGLRGGPGGAHRVRRELWRRVGGAERALGVARDVGAPLGDLPALLRRTRAAADEVDRLLAAADGRLSRDAGLARRADEVTRTAAGIQEAALQAANGVMADRLAPLGHDTDIEVRSLAHGAAAGRAVGPTLPSV
jgi:hypothetical protein